MWVSCLSDPWNHFRKEDCNWCIHEHLSVSHSSKIWRKSTDKWSRRNNQVNASGSCVLTASVVRVSVNTYWLTGCWLIYQLILTQHLKQVLADMSIDSGCLSTYTCHANTLPLPVPLHFHFRFDPTVKVKGKEHVHVYSCSVFPAT